MNSFNNITKAVLHHLFTKRCIGGKHIPEKKVIKRKLKKASKEDIHQFFHEYKILVNNGYIIRLKKKTGMGSDWHISINPRSTKEVEEIIKGTIQ